VQLTMEIFILQPHAMHQDVKNMCIAIFKINFPAQMLSNTCPMFPRLAVY
jgi:hypothetical protein